MTGKYIKPILNTIVAVGAALVVALGTGNTDIGSIDTLSWLTALGTVIGSSALVWWTQNGPAAPAIKAILAFLGAGVPALVVALDGPDRVITQAEWITAFVAGVVALSAVFQSTDPALPPNGGAT